MKKLVGIFASVALLGSGVAFAQGDVSGGTQQPGAAQGGSGAAGSGSTQGSSQGSSGSSSGSIDQGGSGAMGGSGTTSQNAAGQQELTGKVVKSSSKMVWVDHMGAIVPLEVDSKTQFTDPTLKGAKSLKEGQEIRASFEVKETKNVAKSITPSTGTGGSGSDVMSPDSSINQGAGGSGMDQDKTQGGTGGSGMDDSSKDKTMNPDTGSNTGTSSSPDTY
jgi:hypothetical protein